MNLKCAIVDDEPLALNLLESYVNKTPFLELAGKYSSAVQAMSDLPDKRVDLLFLDIQMPELNGLEFSRMVDTHTRIVFTTAFDQYAIDGYRVNAQGLGCSPIKVARELGSERRETVRSLSIVGAGDLRGSDTSTRGPCWTYRWFTGCPARGTAGYLSTDRISAESI